VKPIIRIFPFTELELIAHGLSVLDPCILMSTHQKSLSTYLLIFESSFKRHL